MFLPAAGLFQAEDMWTWIQKLRRRVELSIWNVQAEDLGKGAVY